MGHFITSHGVELELKKSSGRAQGPSPTITMFMHIAFLCIGMDISEQSRSSSAIFSPLPSDVQVLSQNIDSTLSPLTISAHDIEGGSMDFTELANPDSNLSLNPTPLNLHVSNGTDALSGVSEMTMNSGLKLDSEADVVMFRNKENFFTPPKSTSSPSAPIRVHVSAKKLREIQSPYDSFASNSSLGNTSPLCSYVAPGTSEVRRPLSSDAHINTFSLKPPPNGFMSIETSSPPRTGDIKSMPLVELGPSLLKDTDSIPNCEASLSTPVALSPVHVITGRSGKNVHKQDEQSKLFEITRSIQSLRMDNWSHV